MVTREEIEMYGSHILAWDNDSTETAKLFVGEFFKTSVGEQILAQGLKNTANMELVLSTAQEATGHENVSLKEFVSAATQLFLAGDLRPKPAPVAEVPAPPQLSSSQRAWSEFRQWSESHTSEQCKQRARSEKGFGDFYRKNLEREFANTPVGDGVRPAGEPEKKIRPSAELVEFVEKYNRTPSDQLRPCAGYVVLAGEKMLYSEYVETLERAAQARLI